MPGKIVFYRQQGILHQTTKVSSRSHEKEAERYAMQVALEEEEEYLLRRFSGEVDVRNKMFDVVFFEGPEVLAKFGGVTVFSVAE